MWGCDFSYHFTQYKYLCTSIHLQGIKVDWVPMYAYNYLCVLCEYIWDSLANFDSLYYDASYVETCEWVIHALWGMNDLGVKQCVAFWSGEF